MAPFNNRTRNDALTASVSMVPRASRSESLRVTKSKDREWQAEAWRFYHELGEVRFAARYIGNALARCRFFVGKRASVDAPLTPLDDDATGDDATMRDLLLRIKGRDGTFASLVKTYGVQQFVTGESALVAEDGIEGERWEFLSTSELTRIEKSGSTTYSRKSGPDGDLVEIGPESVVYRFWSRDPEYRERADSAMRSVLDICEALHTAQAMQTAGDRSRLASAGLLLIPAEAELPKIVDEVDGVPLPHLQLLDDLLDMMTTSMDDPGSAASITPIMIEMKADFIEKVKHITFDRAVENEIVPRIEHLVRRLAQGLDLTPETLLGVGSVNHWGAWQISEETITAHIMPMAQAFVEDLTVAYLRPAAELLKIDATLYGIGFDVTDIASSPNRDAHAQWLYEHELLDDETTVTALGFSADEMPSPEEINRRIAIAQAKAGQPVSEAVLDSSGNPIASPTPPAPAPAAPAPAADPAPADKNVEKGPPATDPKGDKAPTDKAPPAKASTDTAAAAQALAHRMAGAAEMAVERALERAGARLRSRAKGTDLDATASSAITSEIPLLLGPAHVERLGLTCESLLDGAWDGLAARIVQWTGDHELARRIVAAVDQLTRARMFDRRVDVLATMTEFCETAMTAKWAYTEVTGRELVSA